MAKKKTGFFGKVRKAIRGVRKRLGGGVTVTGDVLRISELVGSLESRNIIVPDGRNLSPDQFVAVLQDLGAQVSGTGRSRRASVSIKWTKASLQNIESRVQRRLFRLGLNSDDEQMREPLQAKTSKGGSRNEPFRFDSGELFRSIKVTVENSRGDLRLSFKREKVIIKALIARYGDMFGWSPSDRDYAVWLALKELGVLKRGSAEPSIVAQGAAPYRRRLTA